jgi:predicted nucleic-acid-binding Zn-ribbon protein
MTEKNAAQPLECPCTTRFGPNRYFNVYFGGNRLLLVCCNCGKNVFEVAITNEQTAHLKNKMHLWKSTPWKCPNCDSTLFNAELEQKVLTSVNIFEHEPPKRIVLTCWRCGKRFNPEDAVKKC